MNNKTFVDMILGRESAPSATRHFAEQVRSDRPLSAADAAFYTLESRLNSFREAYANMSFRERLALGRVTGKNRKVKAVRESTPSGQRKRVAEINLSGISLREAHRRAPNAASPAFLPGEAKRQIEAYRRGGDAGVKQYLARRKQLCGF